MASSKRRRADDEVPLGKKQKDVPSAVFIGSLFQFDGPAVETPSHVYSYESQEALRARADLGEFTQIDNRAIAALWRSSERLSDVSVACEFLLTLLLSGQIIFAKGGGTHADKPGDGEGDAAMSAIWCDFIRDACRSGWELGFIPVAYIPNRLLGFQPVVLDVSSIDVFHHRSIFGVDSFVYRRRANGSTADVPHLGGGGSIKRSLDSGKLEMEENSLLPNIMTFVWNAPQRGVIMSKIAVCMREMALIDHRKALRDVAEREMARPPLITQDDAKPFTDEYVGLKDLRDEEDKAKQKLENTYVQLAKQESRLPPSTASVLSTASGRASSVVDVSLVINSVNRRIDLEPGRKMAPAPRAEGPTDIKEMEEAHSLRVLQIFGVPPTFIFPSSGKSNSATDYAGQTRLAMTQGALRQRVVDLATDTYHAIYDAPSLLYYSMTTPADMATMEDAKNALRVRIMMPGTPPKEDMKEMYTMGLLKPEPYINYLSQQTLLPPSAFNAIPVPPAVDYQPPIAPKVGGGAR